MLPRFFLFSLVTAVVLPPIPLAPPTPPTPPNALASKGYLLCDSPLEGIAVLATFHHILMFGGIKTLTIADVWGAQALKAGLRNGDRILKIQGKAVDGMNVISAKLLIDPIGKKSVIPLEVVHLNAGHPVEIELPRGPQGGKA
jgi:membrane-associated protease RseP (regulator of RpoE activity)